MAAEKTVSKKLTRFEKARVLGARAIQLSQGAKHGWHQGFSHLYPGRCGYSPGKQRQILCEV